MPGRVRPVTLSLTSRQRASSASRARRSPLTRIRIRPAKQPAQDLGPTAAAETVSASLVLKVRHPEELEAFVESTQDPSSYRYHRFLSLDEFVDRFAPDSRDIATITRYLHQFGIDVTEVYANHLLIRVTGTTDAFDRAFDVDVHDYAKGNHRYHRSRHTPRIPLLLRDLLVTIVGPGDEPNFHPMHQRAEFGAKVPLRGPSGALPVGGTIATGVPGDYTVGDVANLYNVNPLYAAHIDGAGRTLGIVTLADFLPSDAYTYWSLIDLDVLPNRITQIHVDGGGDLSSDAGSGETSLDVEQSGGLAPKAKIRVYDAPNSDAGFMDVFYRAISDNLVDSLSCSWGSAEEFYSEAVVGVDRTAELLAFHQVFLEAASQGISMFAASGDSGAYDINDAFDDPVDNVLSVDIPAADPAITAAGGTTVPVVLTRVDPPARRHSSSRTSRSGAGTTSRTIWWLMLRTGLRCMRCFPVGGGGGVSVNWARPSYQQQTARHPQDRAKPVGGLSRRDAAEPAGRFRGPQPARRVAECRSVYRLPPLLDDRRRPRSTASAARASSRRS